MKPPKRIRTNQRIGDKFLSLLDIRHDRTDYILLSEHQKEMHVWHCAEISLSGNYFSHFGDNDLEYTSFWACSICGAVKELKSKLFIPQTPSGFSELKSKEVVKDGIRTGQVYGI